MDCFSAQELSTSPYINRFLQPDTIIPDLSNPQSWNRYSYVTNRPVNANDPTGHTMTQGDGGGDKSVDCKKYPQYCNDGKPKSSEELLQLRDKDSKVQKNDGDGGGCGIPGDPPCQCDKGEDCYTSVTDFDYGVISATIPIPQFPILGVPVQFVRDRYGNVYFVVGGGIGLGFPIAANLSGLGFFNQTTHPKESDLKNLIKGWGASFSSGLLGGGTFEWQRITLKNPSWDDVSGGGGIYTPQIGGSVTYSWLIYDSESP